MRQTLVLDVVGLAPRLLPYAPNLAALAARGGMRPLRTITPAVTCSVQSTFTTGLLPSGHGCVANGWYFRDLSEVWLWRQSNKLVQGEKIWEAAKKRDASFTCAKLFWWYNMYGSADFAVTPRPQYPADGRKLPDVHTEPADLRAELQGRLGTFPLFNFWGPRANLISTDWIARSALHVWETRRPTLSLVYLPHLDYDLQRLGPDHPKIADEVAAVDAACEPLLAAAEKAGAAVIVLSEYGITEVSGPVHINRALREAGLLQVRPERMGEQLDAGASEAFAVADHQVAHVYVRRSERVPEVAKLIAGLEGVEAVWTGEEKRAHGLDHPRSGEIVAVSRADRWFSYYYWLDDGSAPDYARTVDIHRKPGYDPVELFVDPRIPLPGLKVAWTLLKRKLGFRSLLDVISLDGQLVRGSHGRPTDDSDDGPLFISSEAQHLPASPHVEATEVKDLVLRHLFGR
jgi:predicted AlkP superfamily pyrophosphatase or phosphodiesterase